MDPKENAGRVSKSPNQTPDPQSATVKAAQSIIPHPIDPKAIAEGLGCLVVEEDFRRTMNRETARLLYGFIVKLPNGRNLVAINTRHSRREQAYTIGHELGHMTYRTGDSRRSGGLFGDPERERQADRFADRLLMPQRYVREAAAAIGTKPRALARLFGVPVKQMKARLQELHLTTH